MVTMIVKIKKIQKKEKSYRPRVRLRGNSDRKKLYLIKIFNQKNNRKIKKIIKNKL